MSAELLALRHAIAHAGERRLIWLEGEQDEGRIRVLTMTDAVDFFQRFLKTKYVFKRTERGMHVHLENPESLRDITVAVPRNGLREITMEGFAVDADEQYYYITVMTDDKNEIDFDVPSV